jgi:hypothetical protein
MPLIVKIEGSKLFIELDLEKPTESKSGKTIIIASTHGQKVTDIMIDGKPLVIGVNAFIYPYAIPG